MKLTFALIFGLLLSSTSNAGSYNLCVKLSDAQGEVYCSLKQVIARSTSGFDVNSMSNWNCTKDFVELSSGSFRNSPAGSDYVSFGGPLRMVDFATINFLSDGAKKIFSTLIDISGLDESDSRVTMFFLADEVIFNPSFIITKNNTINLEFLGYESCFEAK